MLDWQLTMEPAFASVVKANFLENFSYASMKDRQRSEASKSGEGSRGAEFEREEER